MLNLLRDLQYKFRQMRRSPAFVVTAVVTLALGVGANIAAFGLLQALLFRPLAVPHAKQVMSLQRGQPGIINLSYPEVRDVQERNTVFSAVAADRVMDFGLEAGGTTRPVWGYEVSGQYFEVLGIQPHLGRLLQRSDDAHPGAAQVAVLSYAAWQSYSAAIPASLDRQSASTSILIRSSASRPPTFTGPRSSCSRIFSFPWPMRRNSNYSTGCSPATPRMSGPL